MKHSVNILSALALILIIAASCNTSRGTQDCIDFCEAASACEFTTHPQKDACFELCDAMEDNVPRLTGEMSVRKYFTCGKSTSCDEFFKCKKNADDSYRFLYEDGDAENENEAETSEDTENEDEQ